MRKELPQDLFWNPTWPPFHGIVLEPQYGRYDVMWKRSIHCNLWFIYFSIWLMAGWMDRSNADVHAWRGGGGEGVGVEIVQ